MRRGALPLRGEGGHRVGAAVPGDDLGGVGRDAGVAEVGLDLDRSLLGQRGQVSIDGARDSVKRGEQGEEYIEDDELVPREV